MITSRNKVPLGQHAPISVAHALIEVRARTIADVVRDDFGRNNA